MSIRIAPSILSADFSRLGDQVGEAIAAGADYIHVDVMDGHFVPNLTVGPLVVAALRPICHPANIPIDVHLMIERPEHLIPAFVEAGADMLTVHVETCPHLNSTVHQIRALGIKAGVSINPATPLVTLEEILPFVDLILLMTVNPGFGGQKYLPGSTERISRLRKTLSDRRLQMIEIEVDGGISSENAAEVTAAGATILVAGSAVFNPHHNVSDNMAALRASIE
jgi:ribulose-phosphate 3-epimerase